jgi:hypothetical protein
MNAIELLDIISTGETSKVQFKETLPTLKASAGKWLPWQTPMEE